MHNTKKFLFGFFAGALLLLLAMVLNTYFSLNCSFSEGQWVADAIQIKHKLIKESQPQIIIISGSNGLFGFSAEQITKKCGVSCINGAVHAGLGIDYILHDAKKFFAPGRLFVLPLEYELYGAQRHETACLQQVIGFDKPYFLSLSPVEKIRFICAIPFSLQIQLFYNHFFPSPGNRSLYDVRTINSFGDEAGNITQPSDLSKQRERLDNLAQRYGHKRFQHSNRAWSAISSFVKDARANDTAVILLHPNGFREAFDLVNNSKFFAGLAERASQAGISLLGSPNDRLFEGRYIFDTQYHLNRVGQELATSILIDQLVSQELLRENVAGSL